MPRVSLWETNLVPVAPRFDTIARSMTEPVIAGRYEVVKLLGKGGMGSVYEARHTGTGRRVAVKVISAEFAQNRRLLGRFEVEARAAGAIESDHIAQVFDVGFDDKRGSPFLVMEYLEGEDLSELLARVGALEPEPALALFAQACKGLEKAHKKGIIHRDIKPANLFLAEVDDLRRLKILDFGIAKIVVDDDGSGEPSLTRSGSLVGSPLYMSPEQARARGGIDHRTDLWSIGVVLYEMLTGHAPFAHLDAVGDLIIAICSEPVAPVRQSAPWVAPEMEEIVMKALSINATARYQSAAEMVLAARALLPAGLDVSASVLLPPSYRRATGEPQSSMPFALALPAGQSARQNGLGHEVTPGPTSAANRQQTASASLPVPAPATTRTTSAAVSDTTGVVAEPSSQRVAAMGAVGVVIGASVTLAVGMQLFGDPAPAPATSGPSTPSVSVAAPAVATLNAAPTISVSPVALEPATASATAPSAAPVASSASPVATASPSAAAKLTGRLPPPPPPPLPLPPRTSKTLELYDL